MYKPTRTLFSARCKGVNERLLLLLIPYLKSEKFT